MFQNLTENALIILLISAIGLFALGTVIVLSVLGIKLPEGLVALTSTALGGLIAIMKTGTPSSGGK